ncbi:hypothetical protein IG631_21064 [Alternaria alternata]|nr:hypothetical protein IG631_21064 [Alternaria alternata]
MIRHDPTRAHSLCECPLASPSDTPTTAAYDAGLHSNGAASMEYAAWIHVH